MHARGEADYHQHGNDGKKMADIDEILQRSRKMVYNVIASLKANTNNATENKKGKPRVKKTTEVVDRAIVRMSKKDPFMSSRDIANDINFQFGLNLSDRLIRRRLNDAKLFGRSSRKKPLLSKKNIAKRLLFARTHKNKDLSFWKKILWSDETKVNRMGPDGRVFVHRPKHQALNPRYTQKTIKHGGGSIMVWGSFSWYGVGPIVKINGKMDPYQYLDILKNKMEPYVFEYMPISFIFMQDNDPKHTSKLVKDWFSKECIPVLDWPAQSPDLNPIENLWNDVKCAIAIQKFKNLDDLWTGIQNAWYSIPKERCRNLISSMPRRWQAVLENKGFSTKY